MKHDLEYRTNADGGNSSYKMLMRGKELVARKQPTMVTPLQALPLYDEEPVETIVAQLHQNMVVHVTSPAVEEGGLYAVGTKSAKVGKGRTLNVTVHDKHSHDFTGILPLGMIATQAVQDYFAVHNTLPTMLNVSTNYVTALPVVEYVAETAKAYEKRFTNGEHIVLVYVKKIPVHVNIKITHVKAVQEGIPAIYALVEGSDTLYREYNERYEVKFNGEDLLKRKVLLVDIGDGTVEFIYVENGRPNIDLSGGERMGVGHAVEIAIKGYLKETKLRSKLTRQEFMAIVHGEHKFKDIASNALDKASKSQIAAILERISELVQDELNGDVDDIILFGGGAVQFKEAMQGKLYAFADKFKVRVLWVNEKDAPYLNVTGLSILNEKVLFPSNDEK